MSYRIEAGESVEEAVRRIAAEQIDKAIRDVDDSDLDVHETVHEVRKRCKKVRGLVRLARRALGETYEEENTFFRDAAQELSAVRDATSRIECLDGLKADSDSDSLRSALDIVRARLVERRDAHFGPDSVSARLTDFRDRMLAARGRAANWRLASEGFEAVGPGSKKTYGRARNAMREVRESPSVEGFHEWRKRVKYHRYHIALILNLWEPVLEGRREALKRLSDLLGDAHDLSILTRGLRDGDERRGSSEIQLLVGLGERKRSHLRNSALLLGPRLFFDKPKRWRDRTGVYWDSWRAETTPGQPAYTK